MCSACALCVSGCVCVHVHVRISIVSVLAVLDNLVPRLVSLAFYCKFFIQSRERKDEPGYEASY